MAKKKKEKDAKQSANDVFVRLQGQNRANYMRKPARLAELKKERAKAKEQQNAVHDDSASEFENKPPVQDAVPGAEKEEDSKVEKVDDSMAEKEVIQEKHADSGQEAEEKPKDTEEPHPDSPKGEKSNEITSESESSESDSEESTDDETEEEGDKSDEKDDAGEKSDIASDAKEPSDESPSSPRKDVPPDGKGLAVPRRLRLARTNSTKIDDILFFADDMKEQVLDSENADGQSLHARQTNAISFIDSLTPEQREHLRIGTDKFNARVNKGLEYLIANNVIENEPKSVAMLLYSHEGLSKTKIGNYIANNKEFNAQVRAAFLDLFNFKDLVFDDALRHFLSHFRLPGEAQQIDRMMEGFAGSYCDANPDSLFATKDAAYILAFALIMLNTDHHNPNVVKKMTKEEFLKNNKGINDGKDMQADFLEYLFDRIIENEIKMEVEHSDFAHPDIQGWLSKQGGQFKSWKKRYCIIHGHVLHYFKEEACKTPCGMIPLENLAVKTDITVGKRENLFLIYNPNDTHVKSARFKDGLAIEGQHDNFVFMAKTPEDRVDWVEAIQNCMTNNPYYGILLESKRRAMTT